MGEHELEPRRRRGHLRRRKRVTETEDYIAMLYRMIARLADRIEADPAASAYVEDQKAALGGASNVGLWAANRRPRTPWSVNELAAVSGRSKQAAHQQVQRGGQLALELAAARERGEPVVRIEDLRRVRAQRLAAAGRQDERPAALGPGESSLP
jgi:hypothetical protein